MVIAMARLVTISFKVEPELVAKLNKIAMIRKTTRSALIRRAIRELIEKYEKPVETTKVKIL